MRSALRAAWIKVNASYWFIPSLLTGAALLLSLATIAIDRSGGAAWLDEAEWWHAARPDGARATLSLIAAAMIGTAATVFSITIAAVAYASGNYGPRLLTNFMTDRGNQISLGVFIATFTYSAMVLRVVRSEGEAPVAGEAEAALLPGFVPQLSLLIASLMVVGAIGVLVYFLHHIPASIRINTVLAGIGEKLLKDIDQRFPEGAEMGEPRDAVDGTPLPATGCGYVQVIDFRCLDEVARHAGITLTLRARAGDFVHPHMPLLDICGGAIGAAERAQLVDAFSTGVERTPSQDLEFLIDELVEIALRALSPGINDPFTAVTSLHWLGAGIALLAGRDLARGPDQDAYDPSRVRPLPDDFDHYVRRGFGGIRHSAASSPIAAAAFLDALRAAATACRDPRRRAMLRDEGRMLAEQAETALDGPARVELRSRLEAFETAMARGEPA